MGDALFDDIRGKFSKSNMKNCSYTIKVEIYSRYYFETFHERVYSKETNRYWSHDPYRRGHRELTIEDKQIG